MSKNKLYNVINKNGTRLFASGQKKATCMELIQACSFTPGKKPEDYKIVEDS